MVTITDVARYAGVSVSTVSYALSGTRPVRPQTRARVESAMRELGYHPNSFARTLAQRSSGVLALFYPMVDRGVGGTGGEFVQSIAARARELGYQLVVWPFRSGDDREVAELVDRKMADGVIVMEVADDDGRVEVLEAARVPFVLIGRTADASRPSVDVDFEATMAEAVGLLCRLGHEQIAFVNHSAASVNAGYGPSVRAGAAFSAQLTARGLRPLVVPCEDSPDAGRRVTSGLLDGVPGLTAIVTMNELATFGVFAELQRRGRRVPDDISVLGVVTSPTVGAMCQPPLTTLRSPGEHLGRLAVDHLVARLDPSADPVDNRVLPCVLAPGASVALAADNGDGSISRR